MDASAESPFCISSESVGRECRRPLREAQRLLSELAHEADSGACGGGVSNYGLRVRRSGAPSLCAAGRVALDDLASINGAKNVTSCHFRPAFSTGHFRLSDRIAPVWLRSARLRTGTRLALHLLQSGSFHETTCQEEH
jgi:hypothetical protein